MYLTDVYFAPWSNITQLLFRSGGSQGGKEGGTEHCLKPEGFPPSVRSGLRLCLCMCVTMCRDCLKVRINNPDCAFTLCLYGKSVSIVG